MLASARLCCPSRRSPAAAHGEPGSGPVASLTRSTARGDPMIADPRFACGSSTSCRRRRMPLRPLLRYAARGTRRSRSAPTRSSAATRVRPRAAPMRPGTQWAAPLLRCAARSWWKFAVGDKNPLSTRDGDRRRGVTSAVGSMIGPRWPRWTLRTPSPRGGRIIIFRRPTSLPRPDVVLIRAPGPLPRPGHLPFTNTTATGPMDGKGQLTQRRAKTQWRRYRSGEGAGA